MAMASTTLVQFPDNKGGRPPHVPTEQTRERVRELAASGARLIDVAIDLDISDQTVMKYYRDDLRRARVKAHAKVGKSIYERAIAGENWAATLYAKTQMGWREKQKVEVESKTVNVNVMAATTAKERMDLFMDMVRKASYGPRLETDDDDE
jgi:hypothetical protein